MTMRKMVVAAPHSRLIASKINRTFAPQLYQSLGNVTESVTNPNDGYSRPGKTSGLELELVDSDVIFL
jgi:hypothetical protein